MARCKNKQSPSQTRTDTASQAVSSRLREQDKDSAQPIISMEGNEADPKAAPLVLQLAEAYYSLLKPVQGATAVVWQARRLASPPAGELQLLLPSEETRTQLVDAAQTGVMYVDLEQSGELVTLKVAMPGKETAFEQEVKALQRIGDSVLKLHFPVLGQLSPEDFPCLITEWVEGNPLSQHSEPYPEAEGLQISLQLTNILYTARLSAPDVILTDSLNSESLRIAYNKNHAPVARLSDWSIYEKQESQFREKTLIQLGRVMMQVFAPALELQFDSTSKDLLLEDLGRGAVDHPGSQQWDALSSGTRTLLRRVLQRDFEGGADALINNVRQAIEAQIQAWKTASPHLQAQIETGAARLNWLDIAAARGERVSEDERRQLHYQVLDEYGKNDQHLLALLNLYTVLRCYPQDASFRWAFLFHTVARASHVPRSYIRLRLGETLAAMREGSFDLARALLDSRRSYFPRREADPLTARIVAALFNRIEILRLAPSTLRALQEEWRIEEAEAVFLTLSTLQSQSDEWEHQVLPGTDPATGQALAALQTAIADYRAQHADYEAFVDHPELLATTRVNKFEQTIQRVLRLGELGQQADGDDLALEALSRLEQAEASYPDLWEGRDGELSAYRLALQNFLVTRWNERTRQALQKEKYHKAAQILQMAYRIGPDTLLVKDTQLVLDGLTKAQNHYQNAEYAQALSDLEQPISLAWTEILPLLLAWQGAAGMGDKLQQAEEIWQKWPGSVPHAAQIIQLCILAYRETEKWDGPAQLRPQVVARQQRAVRFWEQCLEVLRAQLDATLQHPTGEVVPYHRTSFLHYVQAAQTALRALDEENLPAKSPLALLRNQLAFFWRKAQCIYAYDRAATLLDAKDYTQALTPAREADKLHLHDPQIDAARHRLAETASTHLQKEWGNVCQAIGKGNAFPQVLATVFSQFSKADTPLGSLVEIGNRFLEKGNIKTTGPALEYIFASSPNHKTCVEFGHYLAKYRPDDCRFWFYHYGVVAGLVRRQKHEDALEMADFAAREQKNSPHLVEQRADACAAVQGKLREGWLVRYQQMSGRGRIAQNMQQGLAFQGINPALIKLADDLMPISPPAAEIALALAGSLYSDEQSAAFGDTIATVRPDGYPALLKEINQLFEKHTQTQLEEASQTIYAQKDGEKLRFDVRHALTYIFARDRLRKARQSLTFAARIAPDPELARRVTLVRLSGWLFSLLTLALLGGVIWAIWVLVT